MGGSAAPAAPAAAAKAAPAKPGAKPGAGAGAVVPGDEDLVVPEGHVVRVADRSTLPHLVVQVRRAATAGREGGRKGGGPGACTQQQSCGALCAYQCMACSTADH